MKKTTSEMELIPVDKLVPYVNNARTHSAKQINKLRASLRARRQFEASRKVAKVHQNVLVFVKGDAKRATQKLDNNINWFKDVETDEDDSSEIA